jgi:hypothetical protein
MTNEREESVPYWLKTVAPPALSPTGPWPFPPINSALLAMIDPSKLPIPPATPPWFPPAAPASNLAAPATHLDSANFWSAAPALPASPAPLSTRGVLGSFGQPQYGVREPTQSVVRKATDPDDFSRWLATTVAPGTNNPVRSVSPDDFVPDNNRAINRAALAALRSPMLFPHMADPDFWKPPGPPSMTPTPEGKLQPADYDPRRAGVAADLINLAVSSFPVGGPAAGAGLKSGAAVLPMVARRIARTALPMAEAARMARAKALSYADEPFFRGEARGDLPTRYPDGAYFSCNREIAKGFAQRGGQDAPREFRLKLDKAFKDYSDVSAEQYGRLVASALDSDPQLAAGMVDMIAPGKDVNWFLGFAKALPDATVARRGGGALVRQMIEQGASNPDRVFVRAGFDALDSGRDVRKLTGEGIRLKEATFDPKKARSHNITASVAAGTAAAPTLADLLRAMSDSRQE